MRNVFIASFLLLFSHASFSLSWDSDNDPKLMADPIGGQLEYNLNKLPAKATVSQKPWPDTYWPTFEKGLAKRWKGEIKLHKKARETFNSHMNRSYKNNQYQNRINEYWKYDMDQIFFTEEEVRLMSPDERDQLSPAEKYDILRGDFNYTFTRSELERTDPRNYPDNNVPTWEGLCHGWAAAACMFKEPHPTVARAHGTRSPREAFQLPFSSSDIKGLLTIMQGNFAQNANEYFAGTRCNRDRKDVRDWASSSDAQDINAGSFHIILANYIGVHDKAFVFDRTPDAEVWNQPVEGYETEYLKIHQRPAADAHPTAVQEVEVLTTVHYTIETDALHEAQNPKGDRYQRYVVRQPYRYNLDIDAQGRIVGGRWIDTDQPDFVWLQERSEFPPDFEPLKRLHEQSIKEKNDPMEEDNPMEWDRNGRR